MLTTTANDHLFGQVAIEQTKKHPQTNNIKMTYGQQTNKEHYYFWPYVHLTNTDNIFCFGHLPIESKAFMLMFVNMSMKQEDHF